MSLQTITPEMAAALAWRGTTACSSRTSGRAARRRPPGCSPATSCVSVDGQPAENLPTVNYSFRLRDSTEKVQIVVLRGTTEHTLSVVAVEQKSEFDTMASLADPEKNLVPELGILGIEIDPREVTAASGLRDPYGIVVAARAAGARSEVPLQPRDVIRSLNNTKMYVAQPAQNRRQRAQAGRSGDAAGPT